MWEQKAVTALFRLLNFKYVSRGYVLLDVDIVSLEPSCIRKNTLNTTYSFVNLRNFVRISFKGGEELPTGQTALFSQ